MSIAKFRRKDQSRIFALAALMALVAGRSWTSIHHLPPDPALGFQWAVKNSGPLQIFSLSDGYLQLFPRIIAEALAYVPLGQLTYWATALNTAVVACCAWVIGCCGTLRRDARLGAYLAVTTATAFAAYEGLVGNVWSVRWTMLAAVFAINATPEFINKHRNVAIGLCIITGLSHAYIFIPALIHLLRLVLGRPRRPQALGYSISLVVTSLVQLSAFLVSGSRLQKYGEATFYLPWSGAGVFWLAIFVGPLLLVAGCSLTLFLRHATTASSRQEDFLCVLQAGLLALLSYFQLGIKSSPAVATISVGLFVLLTQHRNSERPSLQIRSANVIALTASLFVLVLSVRYYFASDYLTSGPTWVSEVARSMTDCLEDSESIASLVYYREGDMLTVESMTCAELKSWDKWLWQR